jgi:hypothetical protein
MAVVAFLALSGVALASQVSLITSFIRNSDSGPELTIIARADGTFDIKEFAEKDQWFAPEVVGKNLEITANYRFGRSVESGNISVLLQADPGVNEATVRAGLLSARQHGFHRIGFTDPRLEKIVRHVAQSLETVPAVGERAQKPAEVRERN